MSQGQDLQKGIKFMKVVTTFTQTKHLLISIQNHELLVNLINTVLHNKFLLKVRNSFNKIRVLIYLNLSAKLRLTITLNTNNNKKIIKFRMKHHNSNWNSLHRLPNNYLIIIKKALNNSHSSNNSNKLQWIRSDKRNPSLLKLILINSMAINIILSMDWTRQVLLKIFEKYTINLNFK